MSTIDTVNTTSSYVCGAGPTKRSTRSEMALRRSTLLEIARDAQPCSVRHLYYRAVVAGIVEKKETGYRKVQRQVLELRRSGQLPFYWVTDDGRRAHWPLVDPSPESALSYAAGRYRRDPWQVSPDSPQVEVWVESESIAGVLRPLVEQYAVPIYPLKGQTSETFAWNAAKEYTSRRPVTVLYAGDYDPAGLQIGSQLEGKLRKYAHDDVKITFTRVAINDEQATSLQSLGTPAKQSHWVDFDEARHQFVGRAVEAEAIDPKVLRTLFSQTIEDVTMNSFGYDIFAENRAIERLDRQRLDDLARGWSS